MCRDLVTLLTVSTELIIAHVGPVSLKEKVFVALSRGRRDWLCLHHL